LYLVLFTASVLVIFVVIYWTTADYMAQALDLSVETELSSLADIERSSGPAALAAAIADRARTPAGRSAYALLLDPSGVKLAGNLAARPPHIGWQDLPMPKNSEGAEEGDMMRVKGLLLPDGYFLLVGQSAYQLRETDEVIVRAFGWGLLVTVILGLIGGVLMSTGMLRRVESIRVTAQAIMAGNLAERIPTRGTGDDFDLLSVSLNEMLDRIHTLMEGLRQVSNDIAHDLRTPLTRLRQRLEIARTRSTTVDEYRQLVDTVIRDTDEILKTFAAMLRVAEIEAGTARARFAPVDLSALLKAIVELYAALAEDQQQSLEGRIDHGLVVRGDRELLTQMFVNLVENALRHTPPGTRIEMTAALVAGRPVCGIADSGPGIPPAERDKVFRRFYRLDASRATAGSGLGLSLVAAIAELHHVKVALADNAPGLRVTLHFPASG
ncbi:MAG TPA: HAMP domain-containing sensor histidine kinase, partial [Verrucomicrobiae bacterium]|nr:HAMP domain-containing sensor histidine kinase [Verrucomicrobiae bacterium]